ncbi:UBC-like protein, partial [Piedraia hortae CBS 480.64]
MNPPTGCKVSVPDEADINVWNVVMDGPPGSVYSGGRFKLEIKLPDTYPFKPPVVSFKTKIYHPNVTNDQYGSMCLGMLRSDEWKPPNKVGEVLKMIRTVMSSPQPDDAVEASIAEMYRNDRKMFDKTAKDWVSRYA